MKPQVCLPDAKPMNGTALRGTAASLRDAPAPAPTLRAVTTLAGLAHDLRGLLATADLVLDPLISHGDCDVRRWASRASQQIARAVELCSQTITADSRPTPGPNVPVSLSEVIRQAATYALPAEIGGPTFRLTDPDRVVWSTCRSTLFRVMFNLIKNARESAVSRPDGVIFVSVRLDRSRLVIDVADNGRGMPDAVAHAVRHAIAGQPICSTKPCVGLTTTLELCRALDGKLTVIKTGPAGTTMRCVFERP